MAFIMALTVIMSEAVASRSAFVTRCSSARRANSLNQACHSATGSRANCARMAASRACMSPKPARAFHVSAGDIELRSDSPAGAVVGEASPMTDRKGTGLGAVSARDEAVTVS